MKVSCDVIKDILPLYVENMVSDDTRNLVDQHICDCSSCAEALNVAARNPKVPVETDIKPFKNVEKQIRSKKRWTVISAVLIFFTILTTVMMFLYVPVWLTADEAFEYVELRDDGFLRFKEKNPQVTSGVYGVVIRAVDGIHGGYLLKMERGRAILPPIIHPEKTEASKNGYFAVGPAYKNGEIYIDPAKTNYYYIDITDGTIEKVLWDGGHYIPTGHVMYHNDLQVSPWILAPLCYGAAALAVLLGILVLVFRKHRARLWFGIPGVFFGGYAIASMIVTSGRFLAYDNFDLKSKLGCILSLTVLFFLSFLCVRKTKKFF